MASERGQRLPGADHDRQNGQERDQPVARRAGLRKDDVPGRFSAQRVSPATHGFDYVAVAHASADECAAQPAQRDLQPQVAHLRGDDRPFGQAAGFDTVSGGDRQDGVPVGDRAGLVDQNGAVGVAVQADAELGAVFADQPLHVVRVQRPAVAVDVPAVRLDADRNHVRAQFGQDVGGDLVGRAVGAVDHDLDAFQRQFARKRVLDEHVVAAQGVVHADRFADEVRGGPRGRGRRPPHEGGDVVLDRVGQLQAVPREDFEAVVLKGVVRRRDHDARIGAQAAGQKGDPGRGHRPDQQHVPAHRAHARGQRRLKHVPREPRVLADHDFVVPGTLRKDLRQRPPDLQRGLRRHRLPIRNPADAVRPEKARGMLRGRHRNVLDSWNPGRVARR